MALVVDFVVLELLVTTAFVTVAKVLVAEAVFEVLTVANLLTVVAEAVAEEDEAEVPLEMSLAPQTPLWLTEPTDFFK